MTCSLAFKVQNGVYHNRPVVSGILTGYASRRARVNIRARPCLPLHICAASQTTRFCSRRLLYVPLTAIIVGQPSHSTISAVIVPLNVGWLCRRPSWKTLVRIRFVHVYIVSVAPHVHLHSNNTCAGKRGITIKSIAHRISFSESSHPPTRFYSCWIRHLGSGLSNIHTLVSSLESNEKSTSLSKSRNVCRIK